MLDVWISEVINQLLIGILEEGGQGQSVVSDPNNYAPFVTMIYWSTVHVNFLFGQLQAPNY